MATLQSWCLLVLTLPTGNATARMRFWRALKAMGCAVLRDGVYLLPDGEQRARALDELAEAIIEAGGTAQRIDAASRDRAQDQLFRSLFDRAEDYAALTQAFNQARKTLFELSPVEISRLQRRLRREFEAISQVDFFPNEASTRAQAAWADFVGVVDTVLSPDEPQAADGAIAQLDRADYQGRTWATRQRLWVDRVASAWLIRRFIDTKARFVWLKSPAACPRKAIGFDFDGARFTHVGQRVTFEVLMGSFGLDDDRGLQRLAELVHALDVGGGEPIPEASGFEAMLAGARDRGATDDELLEQIGGVLDSLYAHFGKDKPRKKPG